MGNRYYQIDLENTILFPVLVQSLVLASGGILSVGSITIILLLLISDQGWRKGFAYMVGYVGAYTLIGLAVVLVGYNVSEATSGESSNVSSILFIILSMFLFWVSHRNWRKSPSAEQKRPRLFATLDKITPRKAFAIGALVTVINFKNLAIFLSAVSVSVLSDLPLTSKIIIVLFVVIVFCMSVIVPVAIYVSFPKGAHERLNRMKQTLETHRRPIGIWVPLAFGFIFFIGGIKGLL